MIRGHATRSGRRAAPGVVATLLAVALAAAGCSGSGGGAPSTSPSSRPATTASSPRSAAPTSGPPQVLSSALLTTTDLPHYRATVVSDTASRALPCTPHAPGLAAQFPPQSRSFIAFVSSTQRSSLQETLLGYPAAADVDDVFAAARDGYNCTAGTVNGIRAGIAHVSNLSGTGYRGERWDYRLASGTLGTTVIGQVGRVFVDVDFVAVSGGSGEIDPDHVLQTALQHIQQRLGG